MKVEEIRQLVKIVEESEKIADLEVTRWGSKVKISKIAGNSHLYAHQMGGPFYLKEPPAQQTFIPVTASPPPTVDGGSPQPVSAPPPQPAPARTAESANLVEIKSPMVGTFYRSPAPDAEPYVNPGSVVAKGQVLCIIEAMKLMNEIEADYSCRIVEILVHNAQPVEYNQPLFRVEKT